MCGVKMMERKIIKLPYTPRKLWKEEIHPGLESHRFAVVVCHRRFGKTVGVVNHIIKQAIRCRKRAPQYAYIAPYFNQAKKIAWEYIKYYTGPLPGVKVNNADCYIELATAHQGSPGARIYILGADNPDSLRGMYLDGVVLDEYGQMKDALWGEIIRPALADRKGWAIFVGTPKGQNAFFQKYEEGLANKDWYTCLFKASQTGIIDAAELESMKESMSDVEYAQELECDFSVAAFNTLLGAEDVQAAIKRGYRPALIQGAPKIMGVDVARFGGDRSCIVQRQGLAVLPPLPFTGLDTMTLAGVVISHIERWKPDAVFIDSGAMGAGVIDRIRQLGHVCIDVAFGSKAIDDKRYFNKRTEMYFKVAQYLKKDGGSLPDNASLREELCNIYYGYDNKGRLKLKSKDEIKEIIGRSPDMGDALALTFAAPVVSRHDIAMGNRRLMMCNTNYNPLDH